MQRLKCWLNYHKFVRGKELRSGAIFRSSSGRYERGRQTVLEFPIYEYTCRYGKRKEAP